MALNWYPIDPSLKENGAFLAFSEDQNADELKPVDLTDTDEFGQVRVLQKSFNVHTAMNLGFGVGSLEGSVNAFVLSYEAMAYTEKIVATPIGGKIYGTRWGAGLRVILKISEIQSKASFSFGAVAANAELGLAQVEYEINVIGISNPSILALLPGPGNFNFTNYQKILDAVDGVKDYMAKNPADVHPKPFQVFISDEIDESTLNESRAVVYGMNSISDRKTLSEALAAAPPSLSKSSIKAAYTFVQILDESTLPSKDQRRKANEFLGR